MQELFDEHGDFIVEIIGAVAFLGLIGALFLQTPFSDFIRRYVISVLG